MTIDEKKKKCGEWWYTETFEYSSLGDAAIHHSLLDFSIKFEWEIFYEPLFPGALDNFANVAAQFAAAIHGRCIIAKTLTNCRRAKMHVSTKSARSFFSFLAVGYHCPRDEIIYRRRMTEHNSHRLRVAKWATTAIPIVVNIASHITLSLSLSLPMLICTYCDTVHICNTCSLVVSSSRI